MTMPTQDPTNLLEPDTTQREPDPAVALSLPIDSIPNKIKRSTGLKLFDVALYPLFTNIGVFVISVYATYLTNKGHEKDTSGKLIHGKLGELVHKRGDWLVSKFKKMGMDEKSADMSKMVFFSFADGSLLAPFVKMFEDRREKIGKWIDDKLDTTPDDPQVYKSEPKQSWLSVLGGRGTTAFVVVNTAVALDKTGLNDKLFRDPGKKMGTWITERPKLSKIFGKFDAGELSRVSLFEAFYTSVCTAGLYFSSRFFARKLNKHHDKKLEKQHAADAPTTTAATEETSTASTTSFAHDGLKSTRRDASPSHAARAAASQPEGAAMGV